MLTMIENGVGNILFGGVDTTKYSGDLVSLPIQPDSRSNSIISFTVALDGLSVTDATKNTAYVQNNLTMPVILDSGTTITYLPDQISQDLQTGVGAVNSASYGLVVPCSLKSSPATINFRFGNANGPTIVAPLSQFILDFPVGIPAPTFKSNGAIACRWGIAASAGRPNLFGDTFLRGAYVVYNLDKSEVAIANAVLNATSSHIVEFSATDIPGVSSTAKGVVVTNTATGSVMNTIASGSGSITAAPSGSTFNLGPTNSPSPSGSGKKGGASALSGPRYPEMILFMGAFTSLCVLFGGSFVLFL
jgi:hypothetical protein